MATAPLSPPAPGDAGRSFDLTPEQQATLELAGRLRAERSWPRSRSAWTTRSGGPRRCGRSSARPGSSASPSRSPRADRASTCSERARPPGDRALEPGGRALLARAREPLPQQHPAQRRRRPEEALPAGPRGRHADRRARAHRAGAGSDALGSMATVARRDGDDYLLSGRKIFITNGPNADVILVYAKTAPRQGREGDLGLPRREADAGVLGGAEAREDGLPRLADGRARLRRLPRARPEPHRRPENAGVMILMSGLDLERAVSAAISIGAAERLLELSLDARPRAQAVRPAARRVPDDPAEARRHVHRHRVDEGPRVQGAAPR